MRAIREVENGRLTYELITGGRKPRVIPVSRYGDLGCLEEEVPIHGLPDPVIEGLSRALPDFEIELATLEWQRAAGPDVLYKVYVRSGGSLHEISFEASGRRYQMEVLEFADEPLPREGSPATRHPMGIAGRQPRGFGRPSVGRRDGSPPGQNWGEKEEIMKK